MNAFVRWILKKRPELRLIISSATLDAEELRSYFDLTKRKMMPDLVDPNKEVKDYQIGSAVIMSVSGRCYPVDIFYLQGIFYSNLWSSRLYYCSWKLTEPAADYVKESVDTVIKISRTERSGDVLLFLTGHEEVETAVRLLRDYAQNAADSSRIGQ